MVAPLYDPSMIKNGEHLDELIDNKIIENVKRDRYYNSKENDLINSDLHYRFHSLDFNNNKLVPNSVIDFKHYFTLNVDYLLNSREKRLCKLQPIFCEQVSRKFANYLSRVAIPDA